jgi:cytochrome oxidase Cu insertion factor (SCO1/SenC/PrrC family)
MGGMSHPLQVDNPLVVAAFHAALVHQFLVILAVGVALALVWNVAFSLQHRRGRTPAAGVPEPSASAGSSGAPGTDAGIARRPATGARLGAGPGAAVLQSAEPPARRFLRLAFGVLWILDGLLQAQSGMPLGMPTAVVRPAAAGSPSWVHHLVNAGMTIWANHPVEAAASAVWIQLGVGIALLVAPRGRWSRVAGGASICWSLVVWAFGEAFGGIFAPGLQWAFGAPGAVLLYAVAGGLLVLPERWWRGPRLGRLVTGGLGLFFLGMALLQAWPGRGTWQGGRTGPVASMAATMATTHQPHVLSSWVAAFGTFDAAHGWGVNLFVVVVLALVGAALLTGRRVVVLGAAAVATPFFLAVWVLVQDFGFFGGEGTDPNSMVPILLLLGAGIVALCRAPAEVHEPVFVSLKEVAAAPAARRWEVLEPSTLARAAGFTLAVAIGVVGVVPMAAASTNPNADPIVSEALNGTPSQVTHPAPPFDLVDQSGRRVSLSSLRGKVIALTFLDPVCTSDCPLIAQSFHRADELLGAQSSKTVFVAIVANPIYRSVPTVDAFDRQERLTGVRNWLYLTGSLQQLTKVWNAYGIQVDISPAGAMVGHSEIAFVIDGRGRMRAVLDSDPGATSSANSSMSTLLDDELRTVLAR